MSLCMCVVVFKTKASLFKIIPFASKYVRIVVILVSESIAESVLRVTMKDSLV